MTATKEPQQDRSRATRQALLSAAADLLAAQGWANTTVAQVAEKAGVSRGAAQHHFPTREALFTAVVEHLMAARLELLRGITPTLQHEPDRFRVAVEMIMDVLTGPLFRAALELWVAAVNDPVLREQVLPFERHLGREVHRAAVDLLGADESKPGVREAIQATLDLGRGLGLANLLTDDSKRRARILDQWARTLEAVITQ